MPNRNVGFDNLAVHSVLIYISPRTAKTLFYPHQELPIIASYQLLLYKYNSAENMFQIKQ